MDAVVIRQEHVHLAGGRESLRRQRRADGPADQGAVGIVGGAGLNLFQRPAVLFYLVHGVGCAIGDAIQRLCVAVCFVQRDINGLGYVGAAHVVKLHPQGKAALGGGRAVGQLLAQGQAAGAQLVDIINAQAYFFTAGVEGAQQQALGAIMAGNNTIHNTLVIGGIAGHIFQRRVVLRVNACLRLGDSLRIAVGVNLFQRPVRGEAGVVCFGGLADLQITVIGEFVGKTCDLPGLQLHGAGFIQVSLGVILFYQRVGAARGGL